MDGGTSFTSVCINTAIYLPWLVSQSLKHGVIFKRGIVKHVTEAAGLHHSGKKADLVVNCTGLSSLFLGGVEDKNLYPARGQIVLVRNDPGVMASSSGTDDGDDEAVYIMHRAAGGGCILGGCLQAGSWESQPDPSLAVRIMKRAVELCPKLVPEGKGIEALSIIRHGVGLRPMRKGGIRVEKESIKGPDGSAVKTVHSLGHGGYGKLVLWSICLKTDIFRVPNQLRMLSGYSEADRAVSPGKGQALRCPVIVLTAALVSLFAFLPRSKRQSLSWFLSRGECTCVFSKV